jgi:hypothetical protein
MPKLKAGVVRVEATSERIVIDLKLGRVIAEAESPTFHRAGRGRGRAILGADQAIE